VYVALLERARLSGHFGATFVGWGPLLSELWSFLCVFFFFFFFFFVEIIVEKNCFFDFFEFVNAKMYIFNQKFPFLTPKTSKIPIFTLKILKIAIFTLKTLKKWPFLPQKPSKMPNFTPR
jgi:hypothetical protein